MPRGRSVWRAARARPRVRAVDRRYRTLVLPSPTASKGQGTQTAEAIQELPRGGRSWLNLWTVHQTLDLNHEGLIASVDQQLGTSARAGQINVNRGFYASGRARQHHDAVGEKHGLLYAVRHEQHGLAVA